MNGIHLIIYKNYIDPQKNVEYSSNYILGLRDYYGVPVTLEMALIAVAHLTGGNYGND